MLFWFYYFSSLEKKNLKKGFPSPTGPAQRPSEAAAQRARARPRLRRSLPPLRNPPPPPVFVRDSLRRLSVAPFAPPYPSSLKYRATPAPSPFSLLATAASRRNSRAHRRRSRRRRCSARNAALRRPRRLPPPSPCPTACSAARAAQPRRRPRRRTAPSPDPPRTGITAAPVFSVFLFVRFFFKT